MDYKEDAYSNRSSLTVTNLYFGYPANPVVVLVVTAVLVGAQLRSLIVCAIIVVVGLFVLRIICRDDPKGIAVWMYVGRRRMCKRIVFLAAHTVADRPFIFTD